MRLDELLEAAEGDQEEALRLLFVLARRCADAPDEAVASGAELADMLAAILAPDDPGGAPTGWLTAHRMVTFHADEATQADLTAATIADAVDELLNGRSLELLDDSARYGPGELLGVGGMGRVERVLDRRLGRTVARKAQHPGLHGLALAERFLEEAELTAQLEHPNIVPLYDFHRQADGSLCFTMKELRGQSLADAIDDARHRVVDDPAALHSVLLRFVRAFRQVCDAIAFAHDQGIAHRDLKPDNIMLGGFGEVQVIDWGIASRLGTPIEALAGTPSYLSPELVNGEAREVAVAADIYALGATLYHLLALRPPFEGSLHTVLIQVRAGDVQPLPELARHPVPDELAAVVERAMAPDPTLRYPSVTALADDVQAWLDGRPLASLDYGRAQLVAKWARRNPTAVRGIAATAAVAAVLGTFGAVRYVTDITDARDDARAQQRRAETERDRAVTAETSAREALADAQLAAARASSETGRYTRADERYHHAAEVLADLGAPAVGPEVGLLDNHARARRPLFTVPLPEPPASLRIEPVHGWLVRLTPGEPVVAHAPPFFDEAFRSPNPMPDCIDQAIRWERDTLALYCAAAAGVDRIDLATGETARVSELVGTPAVLEAPHFSELVFVGAGDRDDWAKPPMLWWRAFQRTADGWDARFDRQLVELPSAWGPWFLGERYARNHGTVLYHVERGPVRSLGMPLAKGAIAPDGSAVATYHEGVHELRYEPLQGDGTRWSISPDQPLVVRSFTPDAQTLFAAGETPTILELRASDGSLVQRLDGHTRTVKQIWATDELVLSTGLDDTLRGYARVRPPERLEGSVLGLLPPGELLAVATGDRELSFVDVVTHEPLRRVSLDMLDLDEGWEAESVQADGALVVTARRIVFVPLVGDPVPLVTSTDAPLKAGDRLPDGHVAFCRGRDVTLRTPDGTEHTLGRIEREECRDLVVAAPDQVFVSDFWDYRVHRFAQGTRGPVWSQKLPFTVFRLSAAAGFVGVGDWTGQISVFAAATGEPGDRQL